MTFNEALAILKRQGPADVPFRVLLACGFTPLHLQAFLGAHLRQQLPDSRIEITTGLYGDLLGSIEQWISPEPHAVVIALEWASLDPRLGYRSLGGWGLTDVRDIEENVRASLSRLRQALAGRTLSRCPIVISLPTLALPPLFHTASSQASEASLQFSKALYEFAAWAASQTNIRIASSQHVDLHSPPAGRFDLRAELFAGLPYTMVHAAVMGEVLASLVHPPAPKKGLITDLDDTLWSGIAGEVGPDGVSWDLASHQQVHGLYQQLLRSFAEQGVLIAVASKNDRTTVDSVFERPDMIIGPQQMFPLEVHWNAKSGSVARILETWNISADSVVFVDDSPLELEEVKAAHPGIECMLFPKKDYAAMLQMFEALRNRFGKSQIAEEDSLRLESIRANAGWRQASGSEQVVSLDSLLSGAGAVLTIQVNPGAEDGRLLELVNKTNQFNLNGQRYPEATWLEDLADPATFTLAISYRDKFGPLGKISVIKGHREGDVLRVAAWVLSCRAFSRRIEYGSLRVLFDHFAAREIRFEFAPTAKNSPLRQFFASLLDGTEPDAPFALTQRDFDRHCPDLYHQLELIS